MYFGIIALLVITAIYTVMGASYLSEEKICLRLQIRLDSKLACSATETSENLETSYLETEVIILTRWSTIKELVCATLLIGILRECGLHVLINTLK